MNPLWLLADIPGFVLAGFVIEVIVAVCVAFAVDCWETPMHDPDHEAREKARDAEEERRWRRDLADVADRLHRGLPVSDADRAWYEHNVQFVAGWVR